MNTLKSLQELLQKGSRSIRSPPLPFMTIVTSQVIKLTINNFTIIGREDQNLTRAIKEPLVIRVNDPSLNRNIGKYQLPHIWDEVLHKTCTIKLKYWPSGNVHLPSTPMVGNNICQNNTTNGGNNISHKAITPAKIS